MQAQNASALTLRLYKEFEHIAWYYRVPLRPPVILVDTMATKWGEWDPFVRAIRLSQRLVNEHPWDVVVEILKHEMAHQYVTEVMQLQDLHGPHFKRACEKLGVAEWARRAAVDLDEPLIRRAADDGDSETSRMVRRAEKLLNLASSTNEHEALLAMQRVREIYGKYNLTQAQQTNSDGYDYCVIYLKRKRVEQYQSMICNILNRFFFVKVIHTHYYDAISGEELKSIELVGNQPSIQMAEYVFSFLEQRLPALFQHFDRSNDLANRRMARRSYYLGVLNGFYDKLSKQRWGQADESPPSNAATPFSGKSLMIVEDPNLDRAFRLRFPRTRNSGWSTGYGDSQSFAAGQAEGRSLVFNRPISSRGVAGLLLK